MRAAVIERFSEGDPKITVQDIPAPAPKADEILVRVHASSVNPIDTLIRQGYGDPLFRRLRKKQFPYVPGLDFAGEVLMAPEGGRFRSGDRVWGAIRPNRPGAAAELIAVPSRMVTHMPAVLSFVEAAALPYVALTVWEALVVQARLDAQNTRGQKVLVHAGAGGIGHVAIQLLKAWGAEVATTCSSRNVEWMRSLGVDRVINYEREDFSCALHDFDVVLNTLVPPDLSLNESRHLKVLKRRGGARYVTLITPLLHLIGKYGLLPGALASGALYGFAKSRECLHGRRYYWALFRPNGAVLDTIATLVDSGQLKPRVEQVFPLEQLADAHRLVETGRVRGKVVVCITTEM